MANKPRQLQISYVAEQDRLLLKVSTRDKAEFRLWLTRRGARLLWDGLLKVLEGGPGKAEPSEAGMRETILLFEHQSAVEQADFDTPYEDAADSFPLGEEGALISRMWVGEKSDGAYTLKLGPGKGDGISLSLDDKLMHTFMRMLVESSSRAGWRLDLGLPGSETSAHTDVPSSDRGLRH